jgi:hypothetical protein
MPIHESYLHPEDCDVEGGGREERAEKRTKETNEGGSLDLIEYCTTAAFYI